MSTSNVFLIEDSGQILAMSVKPGLGLLMTRVLLFLKHVRDQQCCEEKSVHAYYYPN